jgi:hypothetical protein
MTKYIVTDHSKSTWEILVETTLPQFALNAYLGGYVRRVYVWVGDRIVAEYNR